MIPVDVVMYEGCGGSDICVFGDGDGKSDADAVTSDDVSVASGSTESTLYL